MAAELSILIPVYNATSTLPRTLSSLQKILPEHRPLVEVVVVNDGSTDDSLTLIREHVQSNTSFQWKIADKPNGGVSSARNTALSLTQGKWLLFLDADDELALDPVPMLRLANSNTCLAFAVDYHRSGGFWKRSRPRPIGPDTWATILSAGNPFSNSSVIFLRDCIDHPFDEDIRFTEDWLFWMKNPKIFTRVHCDANTVSSICHLHQRNASANYREWGADRARVAKRVALFHAGRLGLVARNNLFLQAQIGRLQQRLTVPLHTFLTLPCNPTLYAKLWVYAISASLGVRATPYIEGLEAGSADQTLTPR